jgi:hypothetical protein
MMMSVSESNLVDDSLTVCWISIYLGLTIPGSTVDHECLDGVHRFTVALDGAAYQVELEQQALNQMNADELARSLEQIVDRLAIAMAGEMSDEVMMVA